MNALENEILEPAQKLIRIPSISDDLDSLYKITHFVNDYFEGTNLWIRYHEKNLKPSIVISNHDWFDFDIILNWHLDVVPPFDATQFEPLIKWNKLYARWAWDMKDWAAIMMVLM